MSEKTLKARVRLRTGDSEYWEAHENEVLLKGELAYDSTLRLFTMGDGIHAYTDLPYANADCAAGDNLRQVIDATYIKDLSVSGTTITYTKGDGSTGTITTQDTNTTYSEATTSAAGLLSASDKAKLNGIAPGAEVNQNAFSKVAVGSATVEADAKTDTLTLTAGANITLSADTANDKITIAATDTTYGAATQSNNGLMSSADKKKLDGVATGANNYSLPLAASGTRGGVQVGFAASGANIPVALSSEKAYVGLTTTAINAAITNNQITPGTIKVGGCTIEYDTVTSALTFSFS